MTKAVAFVPELQYEREVVRAVKLTDSLTLLPKNNPRVQELINDLVVKGYRIEGGSFVLFEGELGENETVYEALQAYCFSLTFFYTDGRATCRAYMNIEGGPGIEITEVHLFIDEYDQFGVDPDDFITLKYADVRKIAPVYPRVLSQLTATTFNSLANALEFYVLFQNENQIRTRLLYLSICLESILIDNAGDGITYKLGMRCANLIFNKDKGINKNSIYTEVTNTYKLRSRIIHGDNYQQASDKIISQPASASNSELDHIFILEKIVKEVFAVTFFDSEYYESAISSKLGAKLDEKILTE